MKPQYFNQLTKLFIALFAILVIASCSKDNELTTPEGELFVKTEYNLKLKEFT